MGTAIGLVFVIRSLDRGGAERQLLELLRNLDKQRFRITLATLYRGVWFDEASHIPGIRVISLEKTSRWDLAGPTLRLLRLVRLERPAIIHGYMGVANSLSLLVGRAIGARVIWGVRCSDMNWKQYGHASVGVFRLEAFLSRFTDMVITNSRAGALEFTVQGYAPPVIRVIPNGVDVEHFRPEPERAGRLRREWNILPHQSLIGLVARLDPVKDHSTFLRAARILLDTGRDVRFVCVGTGLHAYRQRLELLTQSLGLTSHVIWAGDRADMSTVYSTFDVATMCSTSEGFPNVVAEAMACACRCVATTVGDAASVLANCGILVPPGEPRLLADAWSAMLERNAAETGASARSRVLENFTATRLSAKTAQALEELLTPGRPAHDTPNRNA